MWTEKDKIIKNIKANHEKYGSEKGRLFRKDCKNIPCAGLLETGKILKDSHTVTAAVNGEYFIKRYNTKNFWKKLKRLLQFPRSFLSFAAAVKLAENNIPTPEALYADRFFLVNSLLPENFLYPVLFTKPEKILYFAIVLARMHNTGIYHGDLSLRNIYLTKEGRFGVIDLDGACLYKKAVPENMRTGDIARFVSSYCLLAQKDNDVETSMEKFLFLYEKTAGTVIPRNKLASKIAVLMKKTDMKWLKVYLAENGNTIPDVAEAEKMLSSLPEIREENL